MKRNKNFENNLILYLVATPIGNLNEMNQRAIDIIKNADIIACEDTRVASKLLSLFNIHKKNFISMELHNEKERAYQIIEHIKSGKNVIYMSDAGYPAISDPGQILVKLCLDNDICVSSVSGPCALINALSSSGLDTNHFLFYGFLKSKQSSRLKELEDLKNIPYTIIFYESIHRILKTINDIYDVFGNRDMVIARELTKINEEYIFGSTYELKDIDEATLKGEMVLIVEGFKNNEKEEISEEKIINEINDYLNKNMSKKDAVKYIADKYKINKKEIYKIVNKINN